MKVNNLYDARLPGAFRVATIEGGFDVYLEGSHQAGLCTDRAGLEAMRAEIDKALAASPWQSAKPVLKTLAQRDAEYQQKPTVFTPIELLIPDYPMARAVVIFCIPASIELRTHHHDPASMRLDYDWASNMLRSLPEYARPKFLEMLDSASGAVAEAIQTDRMQQFVRQPATRETLNRANNELHIIDLERERAGLPTFIQLIKHHLGIEAAPGTVAMVAKFTFVGSDPYEQA